MDRPKPGEMVTFQTGDTVPEWIGHARNGRLTFLCKVEAWVTMMGTLYLDTAEETSKPFILAERIDPNQQMQLIGESASFGARMINQVFEVVEAPEKTVVAEGGVCPFCSHPMDDHTSSDDKIGRPCLRCNRLGGPCK